MCDFLSTPILLRSSAKEHAHNDESEYHYLLRGAVCVDFFKQLDGIHVVASRSPHERGPSGQVLLVDVEPVLQKVSNGENAHRHQHMIRTVTTGRSKVVAESAT